MKPIRWENDLAIFTADQIEYEGSPGPNFPNYIVVEGGPVYIQSYQEIGHAAIKSKHRYNRFQRFKKNLFSLMGEGDSKFNTLIPDYKEEPIIDVLKTYVNFESPTLYEDVRKLLVHYNRRELIKYIPALVLVVFKKPIFKTPNLSLVIQKVLDDFKRIERKFFDNFEVKGKRKYFPNMRFMVIKILEKHGVEMGHVTAIRTRRKLKALNILFDQLY